MEVDDRDSGCVIVCLGDATTGAGNNRGLTRGIGSDGEVAQRPNLENTVVLGYMKWRLLRSSKSREQKKEAPSRPSAKSRSAIV